MLLSGQNHLGGLYETTIYSFDSLRQPIWEYQLPEIPFEKQISTYYVNYTINGDLVYAGVLRGESGLEYVPCIGRVSPEGEHKWVRYFFQTDVPLLQAVSTLYFIRETSDGGLIATGFRRDQNPNNPNQTDTNPWVLKVDADGCMTPDCTDEIIYFQNDSVIVDTKDVLLGESSDFLLSPNPADLETQINLLPTVAFKNKTIKILSIDGRLIQQIAMDGSEQMIDIDLSDFSIGIYVVTLEEDGQVLQRERLIKQ